MSSRRNSNNGPSMRGSSIIHSHERFNFLRSKKKPNFRNHKKKTIWNKKSKLLKNYIQYQKVTTYPFEVCIVCEKTIPLAFGISHVSKARQYIFCGKKCIKYFSNNFRKFEKRLTILLRGNIDKQTQKKEITNFTQLILLITITLSRNYFYCKILVCVV